MRRIRTAIPALLAIGMAVMGLQVMAPPAANADVSSKIATFPYSQDWSNAGLITANDNWTGVTGTQGYLGQDITTATGTDPQGLTGESVVANDTDVIANSAVVLNGVSNGGVIESEFNQSIALQGSGTADVPHVVFHLDLTGQTGMTFSFDAKDLDGSADDAVQQVAVQYRVGAVGAYTNLPTGYIADATTAGSATQLTHRDVALPAGTDGQSSVFVRVMTTNAVGNDEWVGIDNVAINSVPPPLTSTDPGNKTGTVGSPISSFTMAATGGTPPYTWTDPGTTLPTGLSVASGGLVSGTPTTANVYAVELTVTDSAGSPAVDTEDFTFTINAAPTLQAIAAIQGTGATTPFDTQNVLTQGEVTARYPTSGLNGFYIQTPGADTANASDAIFVYGGVGGFTTYPAIGDSVEVTGTAGEFSGQTQITTNDAGITAIADIPGSVAAKTQIPGTDCAQGACDSLATLATAREVMEGELVEPTAPWTVTDAFDFSPFWPGGSFTGSFFGEIGAAADSTLALVTPTELYDAQTETTDIANRTAYNNAHRIVIDDGSSLNYTSGPNTGTAFPWLTPAHAVRVGASITFPDPVVFTEGFNTWRVLPTTQVTGAPTASQPQISQTRAANLAPQDVGGDIKLATFNVLNFFPTHGEEFDAMPSTTCSFFNDRAGNPITVNSCTPNGPRGAANAVNVVRQRDKIVAAINGSGADIVSLEELENSVHFGKARDFAIDELVTALNAAAGPGTWAAVASPDAADLPPLSEQDVIRNGFIYKPATVALVGDSVVLADQSTGLEAFADAREPLAQAFKAVGTLDSDAFAVIVNHFKSKGSGTPDPDGQGNANDRRELQATALVDFADDFKTLRGITRVFLVGDFNAYTHEDPIQILNAGGYTNLESTSDADEESYNFDGQIGSLDHVLANAAVEPEVTGVDIWTINGYESVYYEYSRFNYNVTDLYAANAFKSSDHNPEIVGIDTPAVEPATRDIQILGTNDFHGRLVNDTTAPTAGAAVLAGAVKQLRAANPDTVFAAAGDLIGATTFDSFIAHDKPTIDVLNEAGLEVSAAGNHEFDQGYDDLVNRVMAPYDGTTNPYGGAEWQYIAANLRKNSDNTHALAPSWTKTFGSVKVGFVGAVTEDLPSLVSPAGISEITVTDIVTEVNAAADDLEAGGADVIVLLVHEGAPSTNCATMPTDASNGFSQIINGVNDDIDAIVSGHTHLAYNCSFPVPGWTGRPVTERPVVSAGQYGMALNQLVFTVETATGDVQAKTQALLPLKVGTSGSTFNYPVDLPTKAIVDAAVADAAVLGATPLGEIAGPFMRGKLADGTTENRGSESTGGNLVAEVQRWATSTPTAGSAQIAFMNPGGLRADMLGSGAPGDPYPRTLTYRQAADVQPFANTLVNMDLTGAQIKTVLEQQWQPGASRPFLRLGISEGFTYTYIPPTPPLPPWVAGTKGTITGMWLNGTPITDAGVYSVTVNSFLAAGGDGFTTFAAGAGKQDTGQTDLAAMVAYMDEFANPGAGDPPLPVDASQRSVGVKFPAGAPASYEPGDHVLFDVSSWSMTAPQDAKDTDVVVKLGATTLGTFPLNNTAQAALPGADEVGTASIDVEIPAGTSDGAKTLVLSGATTGTETTVPITVDDDVEPIQILGTNDFHGRLVNDTTAPTAGAAVLAGAVKQLRAANPNTVFAAAGDLIGATTFDSFIAHDKPTIDVLNEAGLEVSAAGNHEFDQGYDDLVNRVMAPYDGTTNPYGGAEWQYIAANLRKNSDNTHALAPSWTKTMNGVEIGFVGAVTEDLPSLVSPAGISEITVTDIVTEVNAAADDLEAGGADVIVLLVHEGAPSTNCATMPTDASNGFSQIINGVNDDIDAIVSGHTHLAYNCSFPVPGWTGRPVTERPVVSAGQYGMALNQIVFDYDKDTDTVVAKTQALLPLKVGTSGSTFNYPVDLPTKAIVDAAVADAAVLGATPLGEIAGPFMRGKLADGTTENRGSESTGGNLVAEVQRWATSTPTAGSAQIAFMNPGGLRADMLGSGAPGDPYPRTLTYRQAADVQPFANTLVNMDLTGAQIKTVLEQQWQPGASRPFLRLGISEGFTYTYIPPTPPLPPWVAGTKGTITGMWLNGTPITDAGVYSVTVNSFLAAGGDGFTTFAAGAGKQDTGQTDLAAMVAYMDEFANPGAGDPPLPVDASQRSVGVKFPAGAPASYEPGDHVLFDVSSWSMTAPQDAKDTDVVVKLGATTLGTFPLNNTAQAALPGADEVGTASIDVEIPAGTSSGPHTLVLSGATTGTETTVPFSVATTQEMSVDDVSITYGEEAEIEVSVSGNAGVATGTVEIFSGDTSVGEATLVGGVATVTLAPRSFPPGEHDLTAVYSGDLNYDQQEADLELTVDKATATLSASDTSVAVGEDATVPVTVSSTAGVNPTGTVDVFDGATEIGSGTLSGGSANVVIDSSSMSIGDHPLTATYNGSTFFLDDSDDFTLTVEEATPSLSVNVGTMTYGQPVTVTVGVSSDGPTPTGTVQIKRGATVLATGPVSGGTATINLPARSLDPDTYSLTAAYSGDASNEAATKGFTLKVIKATPTMSVNVNPNKVIAGKTKAKIVVKLKAVGVDPVKGKVTIDVPGQGETTIKLEDGKAVFTLDKFANPGKKNVFVDFDATDLMKSASKKVVINVKAS